MLAKLLFCLALLAAGGSVLIHRCLLSTLLPEGLEDPEPLRKVVATYNAVFYTAAVAWTAGVTRSVFVPLKFLAQIIRGGSAVVEIPGLNSSIEFIPRDDGSQLPVKLDRPVQPEVPAGAPTPCLIYLHGGGYALNSPAEYHPVTGNLSVSLGLPVFSPDYRKSPQWRHPTAMEDALIALRHVRANAQRYNIDPDRVVLAGDSAGGHLSIDVTLRLLSAGEKPPIALVLIYPSTQLLTFSLPSHLENRYDVFLSETAVTAFGLSYIFGDTADVPVWKANNHSTPEIRAEFARRFGLPLLTNRGPQQQQPEGDGLDWAVERYRRVYEDWIMSPLFAPEELLARFPPSLTQTCQFDILRDEGRLFHERLRRAGVSGAEHKNYASVHGMYGFLQVGHRPAVAAMEDAKAFVRSVLGETLQPGKT